MSNESLKAVTSGKQVESPIAKLAGFLDKLKPQMAVALPRHMNPDRMARLAMTAFSTNRDLQDCSFQSIAGAIMTAAPLGLEPGINGQGYLIPYKGTCTFVPGWKGLVDLVARAGRATVWTGVVYPGDAFEYQLGDAPFCRHVPGDGGADGDQFTHVYAIGRVRDAAMAVIEVWTRAKVNKHLKQYNKVGPRHYALANENNFEMYARKVALLQVLKYMPSSIELQNAIDISNVGEEGGHAVLQGDFVTVTDFQDVEPTDNGSDKRANKAKGAKQADPETGEIPTTASGQPVDSIKLRDVKPVAQDQYLASMQADHAAAGALFPARSYAQYSAAILNATSAETAALEMDAARDDLPDNQIEELGAVYRGKWGGK